MWKYCVALVVVHLLGMPVYLTTIDEYKCQGDFMQKNEQDCYGWKAGVGLWEVVLFQEFVVRPILKRFK